MYSHQARGSTLHLLFAMLWATLPASDMSHLLRRLNSAGQASRLPQDTPSSCTILVEDLFRESCKESAFAAVSHTTHMLILGEPIPPTGVPVVLTILLISPAPSPRHEQSLTTSFWEGNGLIPTVRGSHPRKGQILWSHCISCLYFKETAKSRSFCLHSCYVQENRSRASPIVVKSSPVCVLLYHVKELD